MATFNRESRHCFLWCRSMATCGLRIAQYLGDSVCHKLKITIKIKTDLVTFQVQAADENGTGVACFSSNTLGRFVFSCCQLVTGCNTRSLDMT